MNYNFHLCSRPHGPELCNSFQLVCRESEPCPQWHLDFSDISFSCCVKWPKAIPYLRKKPWTGSDKRSLLKCLICPRVSIWGVPDWTLGDTTILSFGRGCKFANRDRETPIREVEAEPLNGLPQKYAHSLLKSQPRYGDPQYQKRDPTAPREHSPASPCNNMSSETLRRGVWVESDLRKPGTYPRYAPLWQ